MNGSAEEAVGVANTKYGPSQTAHANDMEISGLLKQGRNRFIQNGRKKYTYH